MGKEELPFSVPGEETVVCLLGRQQRKLCRDRTYKDSLSPLQIKVSPPFGWGSFLPSVPSSLLLGLSLRSGPSSLLLSPLPISHCTDYLVSMETGPGRLCLEAKATTALGGARAIGIEHKEQKVSSSSQMWTKTCWK